MKNRSIIIVLTSIAALGAAVGTGMAGPDRAQQDDEARSSEPEDRSDSVQITVRAGKGRLGVAVLQISPELRAHLGAPDDRGVLVDAVRADSPAARAGVRVGDVIVEVDGDAAESASGVLDALDDRKQGERVTIAAVRGGQRRDLQVTLEDDPGVRWQGPRAFGATRKIDPGQWIDQMDRFVPGARRTRDEALRRIEELERRLEQLERR